jgi:heterodisulfide reductase subunit A2
MRRTQDQRMDNSVEAFMCECGPSIADAVDVPAVAAHAAGLPAVVAAKIHRLLCSEEGCAFVQQIIRDEGLTHVVVAACSATRSPSAPLVRARTASRTKCR